MCVVDISVKSCDVVSYFPTFGRQNGGEIEGLKRKLRVWGAKHKKLQKEPKKVKIGKKSGLTNFVAGEQFLAGGACLMRESWQVW